MSHSSTVPPSGGTETPLAPATPETGKSLGTLVADLTAQVPELVRSEVRLAQAEVAEKGRKLGLGIGMFGAAGVLAIGGLAGLAVTAGLALSLVLPGWASALIVSVVLLLGAAGVALAGKNEVSTATPPVPQRAVEGLKADVETLKGRHA